MSRSRGSAVSCGSLVIGLGRSGVGAPLVERSTAWLGGLMHEAVNVRLTPWRRNWRYGYALPGPTLVIGWRR